MIKTWPTRQWYLPPQAGNLPGFSHVSTQIRNQDAATGLHAGDTIWMAVDEVGQMGLAWEWVEFQPGLVMLADPNSILTNLTVVDGQQQEVLGLSKTVAINRLVHAMHWQKPVSKLLMRPTPRVQDVHLAPHARAQAAIKRPAVAQSAVVLMDGQVDHGRGQRYRNLRTDRDEAASALPAAAPALATASATAPTPAPARELRQAA